MRNSCPRFLPVLRAPSLQQPADETGNDGAERKTKAESEIESAAAILITLFEADNRFTLLTLRPTADSLPQLFGLASGQAHPAFDFDLEVSLSRSRLKFCCAAAHEKIL